MPRITLREVIDSDIPVLFEIQRDEAANHQVAFRSRDPHDRAAYDAHMTKVRALATARLRVILVDGNIAGTVGSFIMFDETSCGYWLDQAYWGKGVATEALRLFLLEELRRPIFARVAFDNLPSKRVLEKCGFKFYKTDRGFAEARGHEIEEIILRLE